MCTCIFLKDKVSLFGRNMDIHYSFNEKVIYIKKGSKIELKASNFLILKYDILGIGTLINEYPFYADAMNEKGLAIAGLNFIGNAYYFHLKEDKTNITPYELPLFLLGMCSTILEVKKYLEEVNIVKIPYSENVPLAYLHFMISDRDSSIVVEQTKDGLKVYDNELNVLTNNPSFSYHQINILNYLNLSIEDPKNTKFQTISFNQGLIGLPGDYSSMSRFVKAYFIKDNILLNTVDPVSQFFYCLDSVLMPKGIVKVENGFEYTRYQSCYDLTNRILHYKTYDNREIKQVTMNVFNNETFKTINMF